MFRDAPFIQLKTKKQKERQKKNINMRLPTAKRNLKKLKIGKKRKSVGLKTKKSLKQNKKLSDKTRQKLKSKKNNYYIISLMDRYWVSSFNEQTITTKHNKYRIKVWMSKKCLCWVFENEKKETERQFLVCMNFKTAETLDSFRSADSLLSADISWLHFLLTSGVSLRSVVVSWLSTSGGYNKVEVDFERPQKLNKNMP